MTELSDVVNKMSHFHLDHVLIADYYYGRYSEKTIKLFLDRMTVQNSLLLIGS